MYQATEAAKLMRGDKCSVTSSGEGSKKLMNLYFTISFYYTNMERKKKDKKT